jgi:phosphoribosylamine--glycine ligase
MAAATGRLGEVTLSWSSHVAVSVVIASGGYPGDYRRGDAIAGLEGLDAADAKIFHAGTAERDRRVVTNGGRVLCATALGATVGEAQRRAYALVDRIRWDGMICRRDIGYRALARERG